MTIRCMVVTPERTEVDRQADFVTLPMYDGQLGVAHQRAPLIGRLGFGTLRLKTGGVVEEYYVDGGFAQVENDVVSVLTPRALPVARLVASEAEQALAEALAMDAATPELQAIRNTAVLRARGKLRAAR